TLHASRFTFRIDFPFPLNIACCMSFVLIFDLDGTLIDSKQDIADSLNEALIQEGLATLPQKKIEELVGYGAKKFVYDALGRPSEEVLARVFLNFWKCYDDSLLKQTRLYPGVMDFLETHSHLPMAVVTNKPEIFSEKILVGLGIRDRFRWLIGGDSLPVQKPDPQVLNPIFQEFGGTLQGLMVGDSHVDIECGKAAGFKTCAVTYGFRSREDLSKLTPDFLIDDFSALAELPVFDNIYAAN
ncbi:MAG TPA: hypothetical protein DF383_03180, partial [Deltaproteobacteria bacterium]|nr:hypothetical protein [Deltaproteobacteria bacterium]